MAGLGLELTNIAKPNQTPWPTYDKGDIIIRPARHDLLRHIGSDSDTTRAVRFAGHDRHSHSYPLLIHIISGSAEVFLPGRGAEPTHIVLAAETSLWLRSGIDHSVAVKPGSIMLGPRLSRQTEPPERFLHIRRSPAIRATVLHILAASPSSETERKPFREALDSELSSFAAEDFSVPTTQHRVLRAIMDDRMSLLLPLKAVAERHSMSPRHIERIVKDELGISFVQWRTRTRLNVALRSIRSGDSLASASRAAGYRGSDGLIKALGRLTGLTRQELSGDLAGAVRQSRMR